MASKIDKYIPADAKAANQVETRIRNGILCWIECEISDAAPFIRRRCVPAQQAEAFDMVANSRELVVKIFNGARASVHMLTKRVVACH
jgi:hypothetical protein